MICATTMAYCRWEFWAKEEDTTRFDQRKFGDRDMQGMFIMATT